MADNLESYFKKHLSDDTPAKDDWNVPSDEIWDNVLPVIQKKRGLFIPWKYLYLIGALIVIGLVVILWPTNTLDNSDENKSSSATDQPDQANQNSNTRTEMNEGPASSSQIAEASGENNASTAGEENVPSQTVIYSDEDRTILKTEESIPANKSFKTSNENKQLSSTVKTTQSDHSANTTSEKQTILPAEKNNQLTQNSEMAGSTRVDYRDVKTKQSDGKSIKNGTSAASSGASIGSLGDTEGSNSASLSTSNNLVKINNTGAGKNEINGKSIVTYSSAADQENIQIASIPQRTIAIFPPMSDILLLQNNTSTATKPTDEKQRKKLAPINNKGKFGVGASFLPTFTSTYITGTMSDGQLETSNMLLYSNNWGLEIRYYLSNRFTLVTGIGQSEVRSWSKSFVDFGYDSSNEHMMDTGEKENTSAVPMPTPFGEIETNITYRFPGEDNIPDGETMQSELETHQEMRYLSIPLGVEFNIIRFSRFSWFVETGLRYYRALKDATQFSSRVLHEGHDMDVVGEEMMGHPTFTNYYLDFYLGTGVNYQFSKSFQISGSARYFNSITKVNEQDNVSTHVRGLNFKIGIAYIF